MVKSYVFKLNSLCDIIFFIIYAIAGVVLELIKPYQLYFGFYCFVLGMLFVTTFFTGIEKI